MKSLFSPLLLTALGLALSAAPSLAQVGSTGVAPIPLTPVTATFTIPTTVDPDSITFTFPGQPFTNTDQGNLITGQRLYAGSGGGGGLNIFAHVPGASSTAPTIPIVEVDFFTTYTGTLTLVSQSVAPTLFPPWFAEKLNPPTGQGFRFFKTLPTQANINSTSLLSSEFAFFNLTPNDPTNGAFLTSTFMVTGFTTVQGTPEPGTCALLGALVVSGGVAWRRRKLS